MRRSFSNIFAFVITPLLLWVVWSLWSIPDPAREAEVADDRAVIDCRTVIKAALRDPSSFEAERKVWKFRTDDGARFARISYRARNGFGGMNAETFDCPLPAVAKAQEAVLRPLPRPVAG